MEIERERKGEREGVEGEGDEDGQRGEVGRGRNRVGEIEIDVE